MFPYREGVAVDEPGHPLYVHPDQLSGRWDNRALYRAIYLASSAEAAIGEAFAHLSRWTATMLPVPTIPDAQRALGVYSLDTDAHRLLDLDDPAELVRRTLRPTDVAQRASVVTQHIAATVFAEQRWAGMSWWSRHLPYWTLHVLWDASILRVDRIEPLSNHPRLRDVAGLLGKELGSGRH